jgi:hypothetical protein
VLFGCEKSKKKKIQDGFIVTSDLPGWKKCFENLVI